MLKLFNQYANFRKVLIRHKNETFIPITFSYVQSYGAVQSYKYRIKMCGHNSKNINGSTGCTVALYHSCSTVA